MKFLVDRCPGRKLADWLRRQGHDVAEARLLVADPGDAILLQTAAKEGRILVTIDTDFGHLVYVTGSQHAGMIRLPDVPAQERIRLMEIILNRYQSDVEGGAIITVRGQRIRVSRAGP